jgi:hypothetical protein
MTDLTTPPGPALRDQRYQDLCGFFKTMPDGQAWNPRVGDWVVRAPGEGLGVVVGVDGTALRVAPVEPAEGGAPYAEDRASLIWLPTLDQLRSLMLTAFSTCGCFTSSFNGRAWWFQGNIMGMTITNLIPLAEGGSAEEAAINALLMNYQR